MLLRYFRHSLGSPGKALRNNLAGTPWSHLDARQSFSRDIDGVGPGVDRPSPDNSSIRSGHHVFAGRELEDDPDSVQPPSRHHPPLHGA